MEGVLSQRVTPLLKCIVLFLFIFTAKVLTSRPQEQQDVRNSINHMKPAHYVRTFTKYHHRRTIQWNHNTDLSNYWPVTHDQPKVIGKRSVDIQNSDYLESTDNPNVNMFYSESGDMVTKNSLKLEKRNVNTVHSNVLTNNAQDIVNLNQFESEPNQDNTLDFLEHKTVNSGKENHSPKNTLFNGFKNKVKAAVIYIDPPTTLAPRISCLYKICNELIMRVTSSYYDDDSNTQNMVENEGYDAPGVLSETTLPNGEIAQVERCSDPQASCYTLYRQDNDGNITVLGQGCWRRSQKAGGGGCDSCTRTPRLSGTRFCCCTGNYCNKDFTSLQEEIVTPKAVLSKDTSAQSANYSNIAATAVFALFAILFGVIFFRKHYCKKVELDKDDVSEGTDIEKGDIMGSGPDALATGLLCVDNLTLIEHIGQGKFGSVWRGSLGSTPVAVKLYSNYSAWQKEAAIYALPHLSHPNILKYYGSDTRPMLTAGGGREHLIVLELCSSTLRRRLERAPLNWVQFASLAHGIAAALAHLHTAGVNKPCVVHRDVNSNNVLVCPAGRARLADLGLAQALQPRAPAQPPARITEAGTLRYLSPEALEGALDLSGARAALCAVDVFALGLVLWEMVWRTSGAHAGSVPPYAQPYEHHGLPQRPTLAQMQSLVSRNKTRPPLPKGPVTESRALKIATDTCDECWDHDAEARLTAVCVEERMAELKQLLHAHGPVIHDNNLHPHQTDTTFPSPPEIDKNSNCTSTQNCDVTTPLLYPHPHIGRNVCIERNTHTNAQTHTVELIHKSLKDISAPVETPRVQNVEENCLSVARINPNRLTTQDYENSDRLNEIRSYQRPLEYVQNDVSSHDIDRGPKQTNLLQDVKVEKPKWGIRKFFEKKLNKNSKAHETEVKLVPENLGNGSGVQNGRIKTSIVEKPSNVHVGFDRPANLVINQDRAFNFEAPCTLSPPNRTLSPTMMIESEMNRSENRVFGFKELPSREENEGAKVQNQIFAVIVPKAKPADFNVEMRSKNSRGSSESLKQSVKTSMSSQSIFKSGQSESEDSTLKKRLSCDNRIITNASNSGRSSRASINLELQYIDNNDPENYPENDSPFDLNSDCSSSEDEHLMLLSENGGSKITMQMQTIPKPETEKKKYQNEVLKEASQPKTDFGLNKQNKYTNFDNEFSDPNDKENLVNGYSGDNPVYLAALNGEIDTTDLKYLNSGANHDGNIEKSPKSPKPSLKSLTIKRQHSLEQVSEIFASSGDVHLQNPAGRVKTPGDLPVAVRKARRDRALQKGRASDCNRLSLYDDRMMFGNSL